MRYLDWRLFMAWELWSQNQSESDFLLSFKELLHTKWFSVMDHTPARRHTHEHCCTCVGLTWETGVLLCQPPSPWWDFCLEKGWGNWVGGNEGELARRWMFPLFECCRKLPSLTLLLRITVALITAFPQVRRIWPFRVSLKGCSFRRIVVVKTVFKITPGGPVTLLMAVIKKPKSTARLRDTKFPPCTHEQGTYLVSFALLKPSVKMGRLWHPRGHSAHGLDVSQSPGDPTFLEEKLCWAEHCGLHSF